MLVKINYQLDRNEYITILVNKSEVSLVKSLNNQLSAFLKKEERHAEDTISSDMLYQRYGFEFGEDCDVIKRLIKEEQARIIRNAVDKLNPRYKFIIDEHYYHFRTLDSIAKELGVTNGAISFTHKKALECLREDLKFLVEED